MRLGLISDIHADAKNLWKALAILTANKVDKILCMGDLVEKGSDGDEVVATIESWLIPCVRGNHDELAIENQAWIEQDFPLDDDGWGKLNEDTLMYLKKLPLTTYYVWGKWRILMAHGSIFSNWDYLYPHTTPKKFKQIAAIADADIILCGHTHQPMHMYYHKTHFINPGSVTARGGSHTCAILDIESFDLQIFDLGTGKVQYLPIRNTK